MSTVMTLLNQVGDGEIVLPGIQRDFVWPEEKVKRLLDSVMRSYPIGIVLLWETYVDLQFRNFDRDYRPGGVYTYRENTDGKKVKLVLDGQQRLQSLYIALFGTYEGRALYFDVLSGRETDNLSEEKFEFDFWRANEAKERNASWLDVDPDQQEHWLRVTSLFSMGVLEKREFIHKLQTKMHLSEADAARVEVNLARVDESLSKDQNVLKVSTIDENLPPRSPGRKSEADVLEIFVRINREGTPLTRSDLIFSMLKLNWKESAEALPQFVKRVNDGNSFELDTDFVIRALFAVSDLGTRMDLELLRKRSNVDRLRENFQRCCDAISAAVDVVQRDCWCASSAVLGGAYTLVPFIYYLFHSPKLDVPNDQLDNFRRALYLFGFARPFSRYADSRLGAFIRQELAPLARAGDPAFPFESGLEWVRAREPAENLGQLMRGNVHLTLHLVQGLTGAKVQYLGNSPELDHIFPRATLRKKKQFDEREINDVANFWILAQGKNRNKSDRHPAKYFEDVSTAQLKGALIDRELLDYRRYRTFLKNREGAMIDRVSKKLGWPRDQAESR